jgi:hypothetical protein
LGEGTGAALTKTAPAKTHDAIIKMYFILNV